MRSTISTLLKRKERRLHRFYKSVFGKIRLLFAGLVISTLVFLSLPRPAVAGTPAAVFGSPAQVTPDPGKGYEPAGGVGNYCNVFATAHKEKWNVGVCAGT